MKKLFKNYTFEFDKNERKFLTSFVKQVIKGTGNDSRYYAEVKAFNGILDKLESSEPSVKFTKDEYIRLAHMLKENLKAYKGKMEKSKFIKRWFLKAVYNQYNNVVSSHFSD